MTPKARTSLVGALILAGLSLAPVTASAETPAGTVIISAERLFGLTLGTITRPVAGGGESSLDQTHFGLLLSSPSSLEIPNPYSAPRVGFDFALAPSVTLGGSIGIVVSSYDASGTTPGGMNVDGGGASGLTLVLTPRFGYVLGMGRVAALWLRGGVSYYRSSLTEDEDDPGDPVTSLIDWGLALTFEPTLLLTPFEHVGFTVSLIADIPLAGKHTNEVKSSTMTTSTSIDQDIRNFGLVAGISVIF